MSWIEVPRGSVFLAGQTDVAKGRCLEGGELNIRQSNYG